MKLLLITLFALSATCLLQSGERYPAPTNIRPSGPPDEVTAEKQTARHTCGWHAIRSIYSSYRLNVEDYDLRARLGVDRKAVPFFSSSKGTVHPDILRVLDQDGFAYESIDLKKVTDLHKLHKHLESGHYALVLINRKQNKTLHWVIFSSVEDSEYEIVDSLYSAPYTEDLLFLANNVQTTLLVKPNQSEPIGKGKSHRKGLGQGLKSLF